MPWYNDLRPNNDEGKKDYSLVFPEMSDKEKKRCIQNLLSLRAALETSISIKKADSNLLVARWNIKEFGHTKQRLPEAYFYIAEILNAFDLIAIQEIKSSLGDLDIILRLLGKDWEYMVNDITEGVDGNSERSAYLYNKSRVELAGIAGEITIPRHLTEQSSIKQLKRTPYMTGFKSGWKKFSLVNVHLHPGKTMSDTKNDVLYRKKEVELFLETFKEKIKKSNLWNDNIVVVGDFNFYEDVDDETIDLFHQSKFRQLEILDGVDTNASLTEAYDRMFFRVNDFFKLQENEQDKEIGGVFNPFEFVYKLEDWTVYESDMRNVYDGIWI